jgi:hypothetical protein
MSADQVTRGVPEIEVVGGYDQDMADHNLHLPLPAADATVIRVMTNREQVRRYLQTLSFEALRDRIRHIQFRLLEDGTMWSVHGYDSIQRRIDGGNPLKVADLAPLTPG